MSLSARRADLNIRGTPVSLSKGQGGARTQR